MLVHDRDQVVVTFAVFALEYLEYLEDLEDRTKHANAFLFMKSYGGTH